MLTGKKEPNLEESLAKLYVSNMIYLKDSTMSIANFYDNKCKMIRQQIYDLENEEPFKFFKKAHSKWEVAIKDLKDKYDETFSKFLDECVELENVIELFNN